MDRRGVSAIVLAGGEGRRFREQTGRFKLVEPLAHGGSVIAAVCRRALAVADDVVVVLRCEPEKVAAALSDLPVRLLHCDAAVYGPGASIKCGVAAVRRGHAILMFLADMPFIAPATVEAVTQALADGADIARPFHGELPGHPVGFCAALREPLLALDDAQGAAAILRARPGLVRRIEVGDPGCTADVDVPAQLAGVGRGDGTRINPR